jgi:hypothetical protein
MGEWLMFTNEQKEQLLYLNFEICPESYRARKLGNWEIYGSTILQIVISQVTGWVNFEIQRSKISKSFPILCESKVFRIFAIINVTG